VTDHPRIRGEHPGPVDQFLAGVGSSPHTRGAPPASPTPAPSQQDHPRIRGEHCACVCTPPPRGGSSPHTRGAPWNLTAIRVARTDHPRIRGEHLPKPPAKTGTIGSSPHTRGAQTLSPLDEPSLRIIPAYAGSTMTWPGSKSTTMDHPRIRGEHSTI